MTDVAIYLLITFGLGGLATVFVKSNETVLIS